MENERKVRESIDNAGLMTKLSVIGGLFGLVLLLLVLILGVVNFNFANSDTFSLGVVPFSLAVLFAVGGTIYGVLSSAALNEAEEKRLLEKRKEGHHAFNVEEDVRFTSGRSFGNYKKYAPYVLTVLAVLLLTVELFFFWRFWSTREIAPTGASSNQAVFLSAIVMIFSALCGAFFIGQARTKSFRWLRPLGAWLIVGFVIMLLATVSLLLNKMEAPFLADSDLYFRRIILVALIVLGFEFVVNFIMEFYRPRTLEESKPIFESSLLSLFTEPGGVMRNIANTLDYQFGFKVSGTWIYSFIERSLFPLLVLWVVVLWIFTAVVEVGPSEVGVRERFGRITERELLQPGLYFTLPWPFGGLRKVSCSEIHQVVVGASEFEEEEDEWVDDGHGHEPPKKKDKHAEAVHSVVLWTQEHAHNENKFLVASRQHRDNTSSSVSFLSMEMLVQYHIREDGVFKYLYDNRNSDKILLNIGEMVATDYLASAPMMDLMSVERSKAQAEIQAAIQAEADRLELGIEVVSISLTGVHPPVEQVAPAFQAVIGAMEQKETEILNARAYEVQVVPATEAMYERIIANAEAEKYQTVRVAEAESERFKKQLTAFEQLPELYKLRTYLSLLENNSDEVRKFILSSSLAREVYEMNFETKAQIDLIDANLGALGGPAADQPANQ